jgi:hypothetical protein
MFFVFGPLWFVILVTLLYFIFRNDNNGIIISGVFKFIGSLFLGIVMLSILVFIILFLNGYSTK